MRRWRDRCIALGTAALLALSVRASIPGARALAERWSRADAASYSGAGGHRDALLAAFQACGSQSTGDFQGKYVLDAEAMRATLPPLPSAATPSQREAYARAVDFAEKQFESFEVKRDRITSGSMLVQEFCLTRVLERTAGALRAEAVWHEDASDPGDASLVEIRFERHGDGFRFAFGEPGEPAPSRWLTLRRADAGAEGR